MQVQKKLITAQLSLCLGHLMLASAIPLVPIGVAKDQLLVVKILISSVVVLLSLLWNVAETMNSLTKLWKLMSTKLWPTTLSLTSKAKSTLLLITLLAHNQESQV